MMSKRRFRPYELEPPKISTYFEVAGTCLLIAAPLSILLGAGLETIEAQTIFVFAWFFPAFLIGVLCMIIAEKTR